MLSNVLIPTSSSVNASSNAAMASSAAPDAATYEWFCGNLLACVLQFGFVADDAMAVLD